MPKREPLLGEQIPFEDYIDDQHGGVVVTKDNAVFALFAVAGVCPDTADSTDLAIWFDEVHNAQKNIQDEAIELFSYKCRGLADPDDFPLPQHPNPAAREIDAAYRANLFTGTLYANSLFLGAQVHAPNLAAQGAAKFFSHDAVNPRPGTAERVRRLNEICRLLETQLARFGLRRLGYVERAGILYDEIAEALAFATTGLWRRIGATTGRMGNTIFTEDVHFKRRHIEFEGAGETRFAVIYAFKNYPVSTSPWMLQPLDTAPYRCTVIQSFRFLSNAAAGAAIDRKQNRYHLAGDKAVDQKDALSRAHNRLLNREFILGEHSIVVIAFADTRRSLTQVSNALWRDLANCGLQAMRITRILKAAFLSAFPGNNIWRPRPSFINSINYGAFSPLYNWPQGDKTGNWPGPEIALFRTLAGTPFRFHWGRDRGGNTLLSGNTLITGETGSGKTTIAAFLIAMTAGRARIMGLDHKEGWRRLFERLRGDYAALGGGEPHCAPLKALEPTPYNIEFLTELIRGLRGDQMSEEDERRLALGLPMVMQLPPPDRWLSELLAFFPEAPEGTRARLRKWCWPDGELGWVIDAPRDTVQFSDLCCYDTTALLHNPRARGPALAYLFHRISLALDGTPLLIPCDEGWRALVDADFRAFIARQLRTIRSKNGILMFITQSPRDIIDSGIAHLLVEQCPNAFHMANPRGRREHYVDGLGLTDGEFEAFHALQDGQGLFLLKQENRSVIAQLPLAGLERYLPILSASERELRSVSVEEFKQAAE